MGEKIAIVGGGFSGALTAYYLSKNNPNQEIIIFEPREKLGVGVAYSTNDPAHVLNVPANKMSALGDYEHDFVRYLKKHNQDYQTETDNFFAYLYEKRSIYGQYVNKLILSQLNNNSNFEHIYEKAIYAKYESGFEIRTKNKIYSADKLILATGIAPAQAICRIFAELGSDYFLSSPWDDRLRANFLSKIAKHHEILIIGSGLSMADCILSLKSHDHQGKVHVISRHGLFPTVHEHIQNNHNIWEKIPTSISNLFKEIRKKIVLEKHPWQVVVDSLRDHTPNIFAQWSSAQKHQFLRHLRTYWEAHRHRVAPQVGQKLFQEQESKKLIIHKGRITKSALEEQKICVNFRHLNLNKKITVDKVINCTGVESNFRHSNDILIQSLLNNKLIFSDNLGLGIKADTQGRILDRQGKHSKPIFALGSLLRGIIWETTAVPELRVQAQRMAELLS